MCVVTGLNEAGKQAERLRGLGRADVSRGPSTAACCTDGLRARAACPSA